MPTFPLLAVAQQTGNPVIKNDTATFLWQGKSPPLLLEDLHNWDESPQEMTRAAPGVWQLTLQLPPKAYLEYAFVDPHSGQHLENPFNPNRVWNGVDGWNHHFSMPRRTRNEYIHPPACSSRGVLTRHKLATHGLAFGASRTVHLYQPPVNEPVSLLLVYDGPDYLRYASLAV